MLTRQIQVPSLPVTVDMKELRKALSDLDRVAAEGRQVGAEMRGIEDALPHAERADRRDLGAAILAGTSERPDGTAAVRARLADLNRRREALRAARELATQKVRDVVSANLDRYLVEVDRQVDAARETTADALRQYVVARDGLRIVEELREWLTSFPTPRTRAPRATVRGIGSFAHVLAALEAELADVAEPEPELVA